MAKFYEGQIIRLKARAIAEGYIPISLRGQLGKIERLHMHDYASVSVPPESDKTMLVHVSTLEPVGPPGTNKEALHLLSQEEEATPSIEKGEGIRVSPYVTSFMRTPEGHAYLPQGESIGESLRRVQNPCEELMPTLPRFQSPHAHAYVSSLDDYLLPGGTTEPDWDAFDTEDE